MHFRRTASSCWWWGTLFLAVALSFSVRADALEFECKSEKNQPVVFAKGGIEIKEVNGRLVTDLEKLKDAIAKCRARYAKDNQVVTILDIHSGGGVLDQGLKMGEYLMSHRSGIYTRVSPGNYCVSACTFVFLGGEYREVMNGASFEPHGFSSWRPPQDSPWTLDYNAMFWFLLDKDAFQAKRVELGLCRFLPEFGETFKATTDACIDFLRGNSPDVNLFAKRLSDKDQTMVFVITRYMSAAMMELEREAALHYLQAGNAPPVNSAYYVQWLLEGMRIGARVRAGKQTAVPAVENLSPAFKKFVEQLVDRVRIGAESGAQNIKQFLDRRNAGTQGGVDEKALAQLMFSTSIVYTRPLTNKEMCQSFVTTISIDC